MQALNVIENPRFEAAKASKLQVVKSDQIAIDALFLKPGQEHGPLRLPNRDRAIIALSGKGYVLLMTQPVEERIELKAGMVTLAPRDTWHVIKNDGDADLVIALGSQFPTRVEELG